MRKFVSILSLVVSAGLIVSCNSGNCSNQVSYPYQFVIDSGSSGSRIYVYNKYNTESGTVVINMYEKKVSIPLSGFANNPNQAGTSISPLLESAIQALKIAVPNVNIASVPTSLLATAGMRLLSESQQTQIYANVAESISQTGLMVGEVKTISGQYEGLYSWLDVNYLNGNLSQNESTNGIFEVGGASAQVAFATESVLNNKDMINIAVNGKAYNVYSISFLGLGQNYARALMNEEVDHNACYPSGYNYSGMNSPYFSDKNLNIVGSFNYEYCTTIYAHIIDAYPAINEINQISGFYKQQFIGVDNVYKALSFWQINNDPYLLANKIQTTCVENYAQLKELYPTAENLQNQCAMSVQINNMMFDNLKFEPTQLIALPSINGTNLTWTLGFALTNY